MFPPLCVPLRLLLVRLIALLHFLKYRCSGPCWWASILQGSIYPAYRLLGFSETHGRLHHAAKAQIVQAYDELQGLCFILNEDVRQSAVHELCMVDIDFFLANLHMRRVLISILCYLSRCRLVEPHSQEVYSFPASTPREKKENHHSKISKSFPYERCLSSTLHLFPLIQQPLLVQTWKPFPYERWLSTSPSPRLIQQALPVQTSQLQPFWRLLFLDMLLSMR